jgi:hypothetical protein
MFIIKTISKEEATGEVKEIYEQMEAKLGFIPPHTNLFATLDIKGLKDFFALNMKLQNHERIDANILPFIRLYISQYECRNYCKMFNTKLLLAQKVKKDIIKNINNGFDDIPLEENQKLMASKIMKALYEKFDKNDIDELQANGFTQDDFYLILNYATIFMAKSKVIDIYLEK